MDGVSDASPFEGGDRPGNADSASAGIVLSAMNLLSNLAAAGLCFSILLRVIRIPSPVAGFLLLFLIVGVLLLLCNFVLPLIYIRKQGVKAATGKMAPLAALAGKAGCRICKPFVRPGDETDAKSAPDAGEESGSDEKRMLEGVISFCDKTVQEVMTARVDIVGVDTGISFSALLDAVKTSGYSRLPVYDGNIDNIKGIVYMKDLLPHTEAGDGFNWHTLMRSAYFVPETKMIGDMLDEFRKRKIHLAVVVDEFGETSGIVSLEDLLEEIVGEISDEYDDEPLPYEKLGDGSYVFEGKTPLGDFFRVTGLDEERFSDYDEADSVAGLVLSVNDDFPKEGDVVELPDCRFTVLEMDNRRILRVKVELADEPQEK